MYLIVLVHDICLLLYFENISGVKTFKNCKEAKPRKTSGANTFINCQEASPSQTSRRQYFNNQEAIPSKTVRRQNLGGKTFIDFQEANFFTNCQEAIPSQTIWMQNIYNWPGGKTFTYYQAAQLSQSFRRQNIY